MALQAKPYLQRITALFGDGVDWERHPYTVPAVRSLESIAFHPDVTFFIGENGAGKSTLLESIALALGFSMEGGTKGVQLNTAREDAPLFESLKLSRSFRAPRDGYFFRAESFHNVATYMEEVDYLVGYGGSLHARSHGEAFMAVLLNKFKGKGLYLLDEPEAALSPNRQLAALTAIHQLVQDESQFIIATHSPILLAYPNAKILLFDGSGITEVAYEDTEHYAVTRDFLNNYPRRLEQLLKPE
ncbi:AAA family ATPase [Duganella sp. BJB1802]|uniref:AAA family ATPase n=1 Tax=Duganella sp. BJB1802 TaxID=2744575 RepID=UPI0015945AE9|nr:AAA family ATPase [Duganella sp. BJB1802]NVD69424.1 AAA family ATPase [Duganella sp. BJB1802]